MNAREFRWLQRNDERGYFAALEFAFEQIEALENVTLTTVYSDRHQYEFLVNDITRTALYKKCMMRKSKC